MYNTDFLRGLDALQGHNLNTVEPLTGYDCALLDIPGPKREGAKAIFRLYHRDGSRFDSFGFYDPLESYGKLNVILTFRDGSRKGLHLVN